MGKLTALAIARPMKAGMHADGDGLYLQVGSSGARSWIYRFTLNGKQRYLGLGSLTAIPLKRARELAAPAGNCGPKGSTRSIAVMSSAHGPTAAMRGMTFRQCAERSRDAMPEPAQCKARQQWHSAFASYV